MAVELTPEIIAVVLDKIACGDSLRSICSEAGMPQIQQIMRLRLSDSDFAERYARAREMQAEVFGDELKEIVDDASNDWMEKRFGDQVAWIENKESVNRSRLRFDQRRWWMSKVLPKQYGDKVAVEHSVDENLAQRLEKAQRNADLIGKSAQPKAD